MQEEGLTKQISCAQGKLNKIVLNYISQEYQGIIILFVKSTCIFVCNIIKQNTFEVDNYVIRLKHKKTLQIHVSHYNNRHFQFFSFVSHFLELIGF